MMVAKEFSVKKNKEKQKHFEADLRNISQTLQ